MQWLLVPFFTVICLVACWTNPYLGVSTYLLIGFMMWCFTSDLGTTWWKMLLGWLPALVSLRVREWTKVGRGRG